MSFFGFLLKLSILFRQQNFSREFNLNTSLGRDILQNFRVCYRYLRLEEIFRALPGSPGAASIFLCDGNFRHTFQITATLDLFGLCLHLHLFFWALFAFAFVFLECFLLVVYWLNSFCIKVGFTHTITRKLDWKKLERERHENWKKLEPARTYRNTFLSSL